MCKTYSIDISLAVCITEDLKRASPWKLCSCLPKPNCQTVVQVKVLALS